MESSLIMENVYLTRRKSSQSRNEVCEKKLKRDKWKMISSILKKLEANRTPEELTILESSSDIVNEIVHRKQQIERNRDRIKEKEDPVDVMEKKAKVLADIISRARHLVCYTGAGVSTSAQIPDYRGSQGIWTRLQRGETLEQYDLTLAEPTFTHMALFELHRRKILRYILSQNCDGLHLRSGLPKHSLSEVHGNMYIEVCKDCKQDSEYWRLFDTTELTARYIHKTNRRCHRCGDPLIDTIVHFGERGSLKWPLNWDGACKHAAMADVILCLGSSLKVLKKYPWLWSMDRPKSKRPKIVIVNLQWTPKDDVSKLKINGQCDEVMKIVMKYMNINVPDYVREKDPIFAHASQLAKEELHTVTQPMLKISCRGSVIMAESETLTDKHQDMNLNENEILLEKNTKYIRISNQSSSDDKKSTIVPDMNSIAHIINNHITVKHKANHIEMKNCNNGVSQHKRVLEQDIGSNDIIERTEKNNVVYSNNEVEKNDSKSITMCGKLNSNEYSSLILKYVDTRKSIDNSIVRLIQKQNELITHNTYNAIQKGHHLLDLETTSLNLTTQRSILKNNSLDPFITTKNHSNEWYPNMILPDNSKLLPSKTSNKTLLGKQLLSSNLFEHGITPNLNEIKSALNEFHSKRILMDQCITPEITEYTGILTQCGDEADYYKSLFDYCKSSLPHWYDVNYAYSGLHSIIHPPPIDVDLWSTIIIPIFHLNRKEAECEFCFDNYAEYTCQFYHRWIPEFNVKSIRNGQMVICECCDFSDNSDYENESRNYTYGNNISAENPSRTLCENQLETSEQGSGYTNYYNTIQNNSSYQIGKRFKLNRTTLDSPTHIQKNNDPFELYRTRIVQPGWYGKGYRKGKRSKRKRNYSMG